jgi:hypothetical protein
MDKCPWFGNRLFGIEQANQLMLVAITLKDEQGDIYDLLWTNLY